MPGTGGGSSGSEPHYSLLRQNITPCAHADPQIALASSKRRALHSPSPSPATHKRQRAVTPEASEVWQQMQGALLVSYSM